MTKQCRCSDNAGIGSCCSHCTKDEVVDAEIKFVKTHPDAKLPTKGHSDDNCFDLYAVETVSIPAGKSAVVPVGLTVGHITPGFGFVIRPRSGLGFKHSLQCHLGEIDTSYRGDLSIKMYNFNPDVGYTFNAGDRVAQIKIEKVWNTNLSFIDEVIPSDRGIGGFGSTGR